MADIMSRVSALLDAGRLLQVVEELLRERFELQARGYLLSSGELIAGGVHIPVASDHPLARVVRERQNLINQPVTEPLLAGMQFESVMLLQVGENLVGLLQLQSRTNEMFTEDGLRLLTILSTQVAVAIQNAQVIARLQQTDRCRNALVARVSHEVRTPLNSVKGVADIALLGGSGELNEQLVADFELIRRNITHTVQLLNELLEYALVESGRLVLHPERVDIDQVVHSAIETVGPLALAKGLRLESAVEKTEVVADSLRLKQVLINLLSNAIKFTSEGQITVKAVCHQGEVRLSVVDQGLGVATEDLERIFLPFQQADLDSVRRAGGTGLGLTIARHIVEMHGGRLWVESAGLGQGAAFHFTIKSNGSSLGGDINH
jgi:signal transduction histidine kinase